MIQHILSSVSTKRSSRFSWHTSNRATLKSGSTKKVKDKVKNYLILMTMLKNFNKMVIAEERTSVKSGK